MAILIDSDTRALIQGGTGAVGAFQTKIMQQYGTKIVGIVTPGKGSTIVEGIPVYDLVDEAMDVHAANAAFSFVPARFAKDAAIEAIDSGISLIIIAAEGVPDRDMISILSYAEHRSVVVGPDTPGIISPGKSKLGVHPDRMFMEGNVGVLSKSGALSYEVCKTLTEHGIGQSTVVGIGGGPIWGMKQKEILGLFQKDPETKGVVLLGEVGGRMEIDAAQFIHDDMDKPVVAMIVGRAAPAGAKMGHAGAIIEGEKATADYKIEELRTAGAYIAYRPQQIVEILYQIGVT